MSTGRCESLNVSYSVGDPKESVDENIRRVSAELGSLPRDLFWAYQVHGREVTIVEPQTQAEPRPRCDILATRSAGRTLMLRYADCTPVLLADPKRRAVAVVHAGWRGSALRAAAAAVEALQDAFGCRPADLIAGVGPAIGPCCYVVGNDVVEAFADRPELLSDPPARIASLAPWRFPTEQAASHASGARSGETPTGDWLASGSRPSDARSGETPSAGLLASGSGPSGARSGETPGDWLGSGSRLEETRLDDVREDPATYPLETDRERAKRGGLRMLDLWEANRQALLEAGVLAEHIEVAGVCTQCESERFFSHRANAGQPAGRFAALIRLEY